jgi:hypothetical protein
MTYVLYHKTKTETPNVGWIDCWEVKQLFREKERKTGEKERSLCLLLFNFLLRVSSGKDILLAIY